MLPVLEITKVNVVANHVHKGSGFFQQNLNLFGQQQSPHAWEHALLTLQIRAWSVTCNEKVAAKVNNHVTPQVHSVQTTTPISLMMRARSFRGRSSYGGRTRAAADCSTKRLGMLNTHANFVSDLPSRHDPSRREQRCGFRCGW